MWWRVDTWEREYGGELITSVIISVGRGGEVVAVWAQVRPVLEPGVDSVPVIEHDVPVTMGVVSAVRGAVVAALSVTGHWITVSGPLCRHPVVAGVTLVARGAGVGGLLPHPRDISWQVSWWLGTRGPRGRLEHQLAVYGLLGVTRRRWVHYSH